MVNGGSHSSVMRCDSFQAYCNAVRDTFFPVEFRLKSEVTGDFFSRFEMSRFGAFDLTRAFVKAKSTGHRGRNLLAPKAPDQFVLNIVRSGLVRQTQFGRKIETPSGYMCLVDSRSPFDTEQLMTTDALYIRIPGAPLRAAIGKAVQSDQFKTALANAGQELAYLDGPDFQKFWDIDGRRTDEAVISIGRQG